MMPARLRKKQRGKIFVAVLAVICFYCASPPLADQSEPGKAPQAPEDTAASAVATPPPPVETSGEAVWESTAGDGSTAEPPPPEEQAVVDESPPAIDAAPETEAPAAPPQDSSAPTMDVAGLAIGMDLSEAKALFDEILGIESKVEKKPMTGKTRLDGDGYASITGNADMRVVRMEFGQEFVDAVYQVEGLKPQDFVKRFENTHHIKMDLDITRRHTAWEYLTPEGVLVTISSSDTDNKTLSMEKK